MGSDGEISSTSLRTWLGFAMMCLGMFMAILDIQVVATSLPTIQAALGVRPDQMSWVQTAYLIAVTNRPRVDMTRVSTPVSGMAMTSAIR
jgi:hypothetical protein